MFNIPQAGLNGKNLDYIAYIIVMKESLRSWYNIGFSEN